MTEQKTGAFEESPNNTSMMRVMCFLSLLYSFVAATIALLKENLPAFYVAGIFLIAAFAPKVLQKFAEVFLNKYLGEKKE